MYPTWTRARGWADVEHIDAGKLDERVLVLALQETAENVWRWVEIRKTWASVEQSTRRNNWSVHGIGTTGVTLTVRRQDITLGHALQWRGQHCFITSLLPFGRNHLKVEAALVAVAECVDKASGLQFPGNMTEKYLGHEEREPYDVNMLRHVLVTPKAIELKPGRLVEVDGTPWPILVAHTLDPWHNEYELEREVDL